MDTFYTHMGLEYVYILLRLFFSSSLGLAYFTRTSQSSREIFIHSEHKFVNYCNDKYFITMK